MCIRDSLYTLMNVYSTYYIGIFVILDKFFKMSLEDAKESLDLYKRFLHLTDKLQTFIENYQSIPSFQNLDMQFYSADSKVMPALLDYISLQERNRIYNIDAPLLEVKGLDMDDIHSRVDRFDEGLAERKFSTSIKEISEDFYRRSVHNKEPPKIDYLDEEDGEGREDGGEGGGLFDKYVDYAGGGTNYDDVLNALESAEISIGKKTGASTSSPVKTSKNILMDSDGGYDGGYGNFDEELDILFTNWRNSYSSTFDISEALAPRTFTRGSVTPLGKLQESFIGTNRLEESMITFEPFSDDKMRDAETFDEELFRKYQNFYSDMYNPKEGGGDDGHSGGIFSKTMGYFYGKK
eukprot:TRINITY_DN5564_c0_g1_i7.p1 TRINITY_DN5564_c0_g1~~TRINITY_DN5564_c0_g1_i7.p1  ORF type:complete len:378 (-),score=93.13 TRINITY_DN5564_c0_g1_i7:352-1404(-)